jgi:hypothetical protein
MPMANDDIDDKYLRTLLYGKDKTKKTWWACKAAEAGFNVILLDGDDGSTITKQLPIEARKRILICNAVNTRTKAAFAILVAFLCKNDSECLYDEQEKAIYRISPSFKPNPEHSYIYFNPSLLTRNDVFILDSWTALTNSGFIRYADESGTELDGIDREGDQFGPLNFQKRYQTNVLNKLHTFPCHIMVIGHETEWEKFKGKGQDRKLVGTYVHPIAPSGPQGQALGSHFSDILFFKRLSDVSYQIDAGGDDFRMGGSRHLAPQKYNWNAVTPKMLMDAIDCRPTGEPCRGAIWFAPGQEIVLPDKGSAKRLSEKVIAITDIPAIDSAASEKKVIEMAPSGGGSLADRLRKRT